MNTAILRAPKAKKPVRLKASSLTIRLTVFTMIAISPGQSGRRFVKGTL